MKNAFIKSTVILLIGTLITKLLGFFIKIIFTRMIGTGINLYSLIMPTYSLLVAITQLGLPYAISVIMAKNNYRGLKVLASVVPISLFFNVLIIALIFVFSPFLATNLLKNENLYYPLISISFVVPFTTISGIIKGYYFGKQNMLPNAVSSIFEQLTRFILMMIFKGAGGFLGNDSDNSDTSGYSASTETKVNNTVAKGSREKYTKILGNNQDKITIMVYMCGTDLESKYKMASSDIEEMKNATLGNNIDIILYTGGCSQWQSNNISSNVNQIYQIKDGNLISLVQDDGKKAMTSPETLSGFIKYCNKNFPANRNELILWDHGGGSVSGYGYDEKYKSSGSMNLGGINQALKDGGVKFDFIGFDACLMATAENAFMLDEYADYLIASEETEPGIGWYYTEWLTELGKNTSMPTVDIGKNIIDDFVERCNQKCKGQKTTLSIIDLAEFSNTVPEKLDSFSQSVSDSIQNKNYQNISDARYKTREFAQSSKIDQID